MIVQSADLSEKTGRTRSWIGGPGAQRRLVRYDSFPPSTIDVRYSHRVGGELNFRDADPRGIRVKQL